MIKPQDYWSRLGAAVAYYTIFSLAPLLIIIIAVAGFVFGQLTALGSLLSDWQTSVAGQSLNQCLCLAVVTLLFAMIYRFLPDAKIAWKDVWLGGIHHSRALYRARGERHARDGQGAGRAGDTT